VDLIKRESEELELQLATHLMAVAYMFLLSTTLKVSPPFRPLSLLTRDDIKNKCEREEGERCCWNLMPESSGV